MAPRSAPGASAAGGLPEVFGPYRILKPLGKGGMGAVYLAIDTRLNRKVALKVCHLLDNANALERFKREAKAAAALRHPNLCPVLECDVIQDIPYFTMAYIEGPTLGKWVAARGGLSQREAVLLVRKLAMALQYAHQRGVIHRDLKPANVAMDKNDPIILDFGLARLAEGSDKKLSRTGVAMGTPSYMTPEQIKGDLKAMGPCTDVFALGVILYELLTGRLPFEGPTAEVVMAFILLNEPPPPRSFRPDLHPHLESICLKAMAKEPAARWASMQELAGTLAEWAKAAPSKDSRTVPAAEVPSPPPKHNLRTSTAVAPAPLPEAPPPAPATALV